MQITALLAGLILALPLVALGAAIPADTAIDFQAHALDGDALGVTRLRARALGYDKVLETRQRGGGGGGAAGAAGLVGPVVDLILAIVDGINADKQVRHRMRSYYTSHRARTN